MPLRCCGAALSAVVLLSSLSGCGGSAADRPNILLITLDTTRADRLGCYGYGRPTSPHLDALALISARYTRAYGVTSWTLPSHASIFTGKFPTSHGARYDLEGPLRLSAGIEGSRALDQYRARGLGTDETTLAEILRDHGYATGGVIAGPWMMKVFGLGKGFDSWDDDGLDGEKGRLAASVTDAALGFVDAHADGPFFLFLNYFDPHTPYLPPRKSLREVLGDAVDPFVDLSREQRVNAMYDAEIRYMDQHIGRLIAGLRERGRFDDTWILVTADHGELLGENGQRGHSKTLTEAEIRIPLLVKEPVADPTGRVVETPIQQVDLFSMILGRLEIASPPGIQGGEPPQLPHPIVAEVNPLPIITRGGSWRAIVSGDYKFAWNSLGRHGLYNIATDPTEAHNLLESEPAVAAELEKLLTGYLAGLPRPGAAGPEQTIDAETLEKLRNLGYVR